MYITIWKCILFLYNIKMAVLYKAGNLGDTKPLRDGVSELRVDYGPGYRVYVGVVGFQVILLLCGGDKRGQSADIDRAVAYLADFKRRVKT